MSVKPVTKQADAASPKAPSSFRVFTGSFRRMNMYITTA
jgi:hypothetical protein